MRRNRRLTRIGDVLVLAACAFVVASVSRADSDPPRFTLAAQGVLTLATEPASSAILTASNMQPGTVRNGIVTVRNTGDVGAALALSTSALTDVPGPGGGVLSGRLRLEVRELGAGGPALVYDGSLPAATLPPVELAPGAARTYEFRVLLPHGAGDNAYQSASASVQFDWTATEAEVPPAEPTATPIPEPTATPQPQPEATSTPEPTATPQPRPTPTPSPAPDADAPPAPAPSSDGSAPAPPAPAPAAPAQPEPAPPAEPGDDAEPAPEPGDELASADDGDDRASGAPAGGDAPGPPAYQAPPSEPAPSPRAETPRQSGDGIGDTLADAGEKVIQTVRKAAGFVAEHPDKSAFPAGLLLMVGLFLSIQGRIDRNDPKLALAPVYSDPDLHFQPPRPTS